MACSFVIVKGCWALERAWRPLLPNQGRSQGWDQANFDRCLVKKFGLVLWLPTLNEPRQTIYIYI
jgi:hypothetical protein